MMRETSIFVLIAAAGPAWAQSLRETEPWVQPHLTWTEVDALTGEPVARPNGVLNPGEAARISLAVSYTPIGTLIPEPYAPGPGWHVYALFSMGITISSPPGQWTAGTVSPGWTPMISTSATRADIWAQQWPLTDFRNPIPDFWYATWRPAEYVDGFASMTTWLFGEDNPWVWLRREGTPPNNWLYHSSILHTAHLSIPISSSPAPCYANCDGSTAEPILTIDDLICFVNEFALAHALPPAQQVTHYANCDGSTTEPVLTVGDFICFINEFAQGCP
jgi:hypothetical protein